MTYRGSARIARIDEPERWTRAADSFSCTPTKQLAAASTPTLSASRMTYSHFLIRIPATICVLVFLGCDRHEESPEMPVDELVASLSSASLETEDDVQRVVSNAAASPRAVMFVHLDWAIMEPQRTRFVEFVLDYQRLHPDDPLLFHYVDCTPVTSGYRPLRSLPGWQELHEAAGTSLIHGWGELVWMEHGRVLHVERILNFDSTSQLVEKTETLMPTANRG